MLHQCNHPRNHKADLTAFADTHDVYNTIPTPRKITMSS